MYHAAVALICFPLFAESLDEIWRSLSVKGKKTSSQEGVAAWLPLPVITLMCSYFTIICHKQQTPTVVEGKPSEGDGFVGPVTQGLGVPTEGLGHIWLIALAVLLWDSAGVDLNYLWQKSWGIQPEVSWCWWSLYRENDVLEFCWRITDRAEYQKAQCKKPERHLFLLHLYEYITQNCF